MIPDDIWESLRLDRETVRERARFYASYAAASGHFVEIDPDAYEQLEGDRSGVSAFGENFDSPEGMPRVEPVTIPKAPWQYAAERADSFRHAATAALLLDVHEGKERIADAAREYGSVAGDYSNFLGAMADPRTAQTEALMAGETFRAAHGTGPEGSGLIAAVPPSQSLYLLLLIGSSPQVAGEFNYLLRAASTASPGHSSVPFGTAGTPLADWWLLAVALCAAPREVDRREVASRLRALAGPHGEQLRLAKIDTFHWSRLLSRVDLVDLDLAGAVQLANRRFVGDEQEPFTLEELAGDLTELARVSLAVGIQLWEDDGTEEPTRIRERA